MHYTYQDFFVKAKAASLPLLPVPLVFFFFSPLTLFVTLLAGFNLPVTFNYKILLLKYHLSWLTLFLFLFLLLLYFLTDLVQRTRPPLHLDLL